MSKERATALPLIYPLYHPASSWVHSLYLLTTSTCPFLCDKPEWNTYSWYLIHNSTFWKPYYQIEVRCLRLGMRNPESSDNVLSHKRFNICIPNAWQWLSFNPLGKVINVDQKPSPVPCRFGEGPHNVQAPLSERPGTRQRIKNAPWLMNVGSKSLTFVTLLHVLMCLPLHIGPPISLSKGLVRQGSASRMTFTNPFVQLF